MATSYMTNRTAGYASSDKTIMLNCKRNRRDFKTYSMFMGGLDVTHRNIDMLDPLRTNYVRIFITQLPKFMMDKDKEFCLRFKHYVEMGFVGIDGIANTTMDTEEVTGGYAGNKFKVPNVVKDETDTVTIKLYELTGSPVREFIDTWVTGISDPLTGLAHYHGWISDTCHFSASNHTMEMFYVATDPTGRDDAIEYACLFANMFPTEVKKDHFNYEAGTHPVVQIDIPFTANRYESPQINEVAHNLLKKYRIVRDYLNFQSGYDADGFSDSIGDDYNVPEYSNMGSDMAGSQIIKDYEFYTGAEDESFVNNVVGAITQDAGSGITTDSGHTTGDNYLNTEDYYNG